MNDKDYESIQQRKDFEREQYKQIDEEDTKENMTLTNEKCIEIAEKIWGWKKVPNPNELATVHKELYQDADGEYYLTTPHHVANEVRSWTGFGRTVEAMGKRGYFFIADDIYIGFLQQEKRNGNRIGPPDSLWSRQCPVVAINDFIEETHLAALEAIDAEGS